MSAPSYPTHRTNSPSSVPDRTTDDAAQLAEKAKSDLSDLSEEVSQQAAALGEEAQAQVGQLTEKAKGMASEQKDLLANQIGVVSDALHKAVGDLESNNQASAQYVRMVADGAERLRSALRDHNVDDIVNMVQDFGRRQPAAFLGAAALLGFAASRFITASTGRHQLTEARHERTEAGTYPTPAPAPDYAQSVGGKDAGI